MKNFEKRTTFALEEIQKQINYLKKQVRHEDQHVIKVDKPSPLQIIRNEEVLPKQGQSGAKYMTKDILDIQEIYIKQVQGLRS